MNVAFMLLTLVKRFSEGVADSGHILSKFCITSSRKKDFSTVFLQSKTPSIHGAKVMKCLST